MFFCEYSAYKDVYVCIYSIYYFDGNREPGMKYFLASIVYM